MDGEGEGGPPEETPSGSSERGVTGRSHTHTGCLGWKPPAQGGSVHRCAPRGLGQEHPRGDRLLAAAPLGAWSPACGAGANGLWWKGVQQRQDKEDRPGGRSGGSVLGILCDLASLAYFPPRCLSAVLIGAALSTLSSR